MHTAVSPEIEQSSPTDPSEPKSSVTRAESAPSTSVTVRRKGASERHGDTWKGTGRTAGDGDDGAELGRKTDRPCRVSLAVRADVLRSESSGPLDDDSFSGKVERHDVCV